MWHSEGDGRVDVILPLYCGAKWLPETIATLRSQTYTNWHLVAIDDRCPEGSGSLVKGLHPHATVIFLDRNSGPASARNIGVRYSSSPYIAMLDQDDLWDPTKLEKQMALFNLRPRVGVVHTDSLLIDTKGDVIGPADTNSRRALPWDTISERELLRAQFSSNRIKMASAIVRRGTWESIGGLIDPLGGEDWGFWIRLIAGGWRVAHVAEPLHHWRKHDANTSNDERRDHGYWQTRTKLTIRFASRIGFGRAAKYLWNEHQLTRGYPKG